MTPGTDDQMALAELELRLRTILPDAYQDTYERVEPVSMGAAGLKFGSDGRVAWDEIWGSFCDLAMAGGPPHKGTFLEPATRADVHAQPVRYGQVTGEISRGITMVTGLEARKSPVPGWVRVACTSEVMAAWLTRAIVIENVAARCEGQALDLPASPAFRLEKEIKNVVTVIAKTCHYWTGHVPPLQQRAISQLFATTTAEWPFVEPSYSREPVRADECRRVAGVMAEALRTQTGLEASTHAYVGWLGLTCASVRAAIWMMRALVASNIVSRREGTVLFVPVNPLSDPEGRAVVRSVVRVHGFAAARAAL